MEYLGILVPSKVDFDHVLTEPAIEKLHLYGLLSDKPCEASFWDVEHLPFYRDLPYIKFHDKKMPAYFNHPGIVVYLGFTVDFAVDIFMKLYKRSTPTRSNTMEAVHAHIEEKWSARTLTGATFDTPMADTVMSEIGLTAKAVGEVNVLYLEFQRNGGIFQEYFEKNHSKNVDNLQMVDFIHELMNKRMAKLEKLNEVVLQFLH